MYSPHLWRRKLSTPSAASCFAASTYPCCEVTRGCILRILLKKEMLNALLGPYDGINLAINLASLKAQEFYKWLLESGDPRTDPWPPVYSPLPVTLIFTSYLFVVALGPSCMRHRRALEFRSLLVCYNLPMMALSTYMFYEFSVTSILDNYSYLCQPLDYSQSELGMRVFFILCKKQDQVTFHHGTMLFSWWSGVKYVPGGQAFVIGMLNSFVHIFMYGHYALASLRPWMHLVVHLWWKHYLTIMQLCQLVAIAAHSSSSLFTECPLPDGFYTAVFLYILSLMALFLHFYYGTYIRGKQEKKT